MNLPERWDKPQERQHNPDRSPGPGVRGTIRGPSPNGWTETANLRSHVKTFFFHIPLIISHPKLEKFSELFAASFSMRHLSYFLNYKFQFLKKF